jgi:hypothetical protein
MPHAWDLSCFVDKYLLFIPAYKVSNSLLIACNASPQSFARLVFFAPVFKTYDADH